MCSVPSRRKSHRMRGQRSGKLRGVYLGHLQDDVGDRSVSRMSSRHVFHRCRSNLVSSVWRRQVCVHNGQRPGGGLHVVCKW